MNDPEFSALQQFSTKTQARRVSEAEFLPDSRLWLSRGLWRGSENARLLGLRVRIPTGARTSASCKCCMLSGKRLCDGSIPHPGKSYRVCVCVCVCVFMCVIERNQVQYTLYRYNELTPQ